jgi:cell division protein FtsW
MAAAVLRNRASSRTRFERNLLWTTFALVAVGIVSVLDTSFVQEVARGQRGGSGYHLLLRQCLFAGLGILLIWAVRRLPTETLRRWSRPLFYATIAMLVACFLPFISVPMSGVRRWIGADPIVIQPSEIAKITLVIYLAAKLAALERLKRDAKGATRRRQQSAAEIRPLFLAVAGTCLLVEVEPDLGTALVIGFTAFCLLCLGGVKQRYMTAFALCGAAVVMFTAFNPWRHSYRGGRIQEWVQMHSKQPDIHTQTYGGMRAVGAGGITGAGFGQGREKYSLPAVHTDYIFATIGEEGGLLVSLLVVGLLWGLTMQALRVAGACENRFASLTAAGIGITIGSQALLNIGVVTGLLPNTGVPLPFISYGGSSLVFLLVGVGILLNIAREVDHASVQP